jgi:GTP-binding protein
MSQFLDKALIEVRSGDGGNGMVAWRRAKYEPMGGPYGGNGGRGGSVFVESTRDLSTLIDFRFKQKFHAPNGQKGGIACRHGHAGVDVTIKVPVGTVVKDLDEKKIIADLTKPDERIMIAEGGRGGRGNAVLASPTRRAPHFCEPGEPGIARNIQLELKLIADVGLIGFPNAGKSTLLSIMSAAKPKIADYPFSTLEPILGVVRNQEGDSYVMADIPGLIAGAASGVGLGFEFLRHIERTSLLVHVVDIAAKNPELDIETIEKELLQYDPSLAQKAKIFALNKSDLLPREEIEEIEKRLKKFRPDASVVALSGATKENLPELARHIQKALKKIKEVKAQIEDVATYVDERATDHGDGGFNVYRHKKVFYVEGGRVFKHVEVTDARSPESLHHLNNILRAMGVMDALAKEKIEPGDEVQIGTLNFTFGENLF